jgi:serine/threonine protein kinase
MLCFDPSERITVHDALAHSWLSAYHDPLDEPACPEKFEKWREIEELKTLEEYREALWKEIENYRKEVRGIDLEHFVPPLPSSPAVSPLSPFSIPSTFEAKYHDEPSAEITAAQISEAGKGKEADDILHDIIPSISPDHRRRSVTTPTDPVVTYARRSSIFQPSRQGSTYNSPLASNHVPAFADAAVNAEKFGQGSIAFPTQGFIIPARSRTGSTAGGEVTRKLLRTLSTVSIHENAERLVGGLAGIAPIGKYITEMNTEADAPPSEVPKDFGIESGEETNEPKRGRFVIG